MANVFLSYRRDDSADVAGRIYDRLVEHFGESSVYRDVDAVPLGINFSEHIGKAVADCDVLLAVIGPKWMTVTSEDGKRRLDDPADYVRIEIEAALSRRIPVIPLLVRGATMPARNNLPESLEELALRNGTPVRPDPDFKRDIERLINGLEKHFQASASITDPQLPGVKTSIQGDAKSQSKMRSSPGILSKLKAGTRAFTLVLVAIAFLFGVLATLFVTGSFGGRPADTFAKGSPIEPSRYSDLNSVPRQTVDQQEPSTDRDRPVWLTSNEIRGEGLKSLVSHYYAFFAGPGEVKVIVDERSPRNRYSDCSYGVRAQFFDLEANELLEVKGTASVEGHRTIDRIDFRSRQPVILRVLMDRCLIEYMVRIEGAIEFAEQ